MSFFAFLLFALVALLSFFFLRSRKFYQWKLNLAVGVVGLAAISGLVYGLSLVVSLEVLLFIGALVVPPYLMYFYSATRAYLAKRKLASGEGVKRAII